LTSDKGVACDTTIWHDFTLARLAFSATYSNYTLHAAEKHKRDKYTALCAAVNLHFEAVALNPLGGFGPGLEALTKKLWAHKRAQAELLKHDTRAIDGQLRRQLEKISAEAAKYLHRAIYQNQSSRITKPFEPPPPLDRESSTRPFDYS